jgi:hypothetical protein
MSKKLYIPKAEAGAVPTMLLIGADAAIADGLRARFKKNGYQFLMLRPIQPDAVKRLTQIPDNVDVVFVWKSVASSKGQRERLATLLYGITQARHAEDKHLLEIEADGVDADTAWKSIYGKLHTTGLIAAMGGRMYRARNGLPPRESEPTAPRREPPTPATMDVISRGRVEQHALPLHPPSRPDFDRTMPEIITRRPPSPPAAPPPASSPASPAPATPQPATPAAPPATPAMMAEFMRMLANSKLPPFTVPIADAEFMIAFPAFLGMFASMVPESLGTITVLIGRNTVDLSIGPKRRAVPEPDAQAPTSPNSSE